ncbi:MAG: benzylsuccinate CoA-transferase BbsF subunit [Chloroflexi bacterium]|jgi:crotonobetainyl-CoA:carnitine CoA-transferase CaiB-like acyl-CoA transferase|nr:MAG: benzylsuccinate CoA-transferase BbsF subunit [Chloroflexota bacterium]
MGQLLAVPHLTRLMADMGAEVIKVESTIRLDPHRGDAFYGNNPGTQPWNQAANFNDQNRNKLGVTLDLSKAEGREALLDLIRLSDVFAVNFRPRVLQNLEIEYPTLREVKPDLIMLTSTGYGSTGPWQNYGAVGPTTEAASGLSSMTGYPDGEPVLPELPHTDYVAAEHGLVAVMAALLHRQRTGEGQLIDLSQAHAQTATIGEAILDYGLRGEVASPVGNSDRLSAPNDVYPCAGHDCWIAISVASDQMWASLCSVMENPSWCQNPKFNSNESRLAHSEELNASLGNWTKSQEAGQLMHRLQAAGVSAGAVATGKDLLLDPHLRERGFFEAVAHYPDSGLPALPYVGRPWKFSLTPGQTRSAAPTLGQHNHYVLGNILGWSEERIVGLEQSGVIGNAPLDPPTAAPLPLERLLELGAIRQADGDFESIVRRIIQAPQ